MSPDFRLPATSPAANTTRRTCSIRTPAYEALITRLRVETAARRMAKSPRT